MKLSFNSVPDVQAVKMISATSTYGTGFWTGICTACANLCGTECKRFGMKLNKAKNAATNELMAKAAAVNADGIMDIQYQISGKTVFMYGIAYKLNAENAAPVQQTYTAPAQQTHSAPAQQEPAVSSKATISSTKSHYDTWQCGNCGTLNKSFTSVCKKCGQYKTK